MDETDTDVLEKHRTAAGHIWVGDQSYMPPFYTCELCGCVKVFDEIRGLVIYTHRNGITGGTSEPSCVPIE